MSWTFEGKRYYSYSEYQRAQAEAERRKAAQAAADMAAEDRRLRKEIDRDRAEMDRVANDLVRQMELTRRVETNVRALERSQQRLEGAVEQAGSRMREGLAKLERELSGQGNTLHGVQVDVEELRRNHREQVEELHRSVESARTEMRGGLERAERQRHEAEEAIRQAVREVDRKVESDRETRARGEADQAALAAADVEAAAAALSGGEIDAQPLSLAAEVQQVRSRLASARDLLARGQTSAALGACNLVRADAQSLEREACGRRIEIAAARADVEGRLVRIERRVGESASADLRDCYPAELKRLRESLEATRGRLPGRYRDYRMLSVERREDDDLLNELEGEAIEITASAGVVAEAAERRRDQVDGLLTRLEEVYGGVTSAEQSFAVAGDPKSDLIVDAVFGSSKVRLRLGLDGSVSIDGYGHGSGAECAAAAQRVLERLNDGIAVGRATVERTARDQAVDPGANAAASAGNEAL